MDSISVKNYLVGGVKRIKNLDYPNEVWGYGIIDIYGSFELLRGET